MGQWEVAIANAVKERRRRTLNAMEVRDAGETRPGPVTLTQEEWVREPLPPSGILGQDTGTVM